MKRTLVFSICISSLTFFIISCGGGKQDGSNSQQSQAAPQQNATPPATANNFKLNGKDVKGSIGADSGTKIETNIIMGSGANDPSIEGLILQLKSKTDIYITPMKGTYDSLEQSTESHIKDFGGTFDAVEKGTNSVLYKYTDESSGAKDAYSFLAVIKGAKKSYMLVLKSEDMMNPNIGKDDAEKAYKIALTFQPAE
jgi:hypothetical protein